MVNFFLPKTEKLVYTFTIKACTFPYLVILAFFAPAPLLSLLCFAFTHFHYILRDSSASLHCVFLRALRRASDAEVQREGEECPGTSSFLWFLFSFDPLFRFLHFFLGGGLLSCTAWFRVSICSRGCRGWTRRWTRCCRLDSRKGRSKNMWRSCSRWGFELRWTIFFPLFLVVSPPFR